jgi:WD40-like Beta Propeller Repeat
MPRFVRFGQFALLSLALACGTALEPGSGAVGPIGPFPAGLTGKVAFTTQVVITTQSHAYTQTQLHVIDMADSDRVIYTGRDVMVQGLTWAPDGEHVVLQTYLFQEPGPNGENRSIWQLHLLSVAAATDQLIFDGPLPKVHPAYSADGRLAYFAGWGPSTGPSTMGIYIDGAYTYSHDYDINTYLAWTPDGALVYTYPWGTGAQRGLLRLTLADSGVTQLVAPDSDEVIAEPAVSPDGDRIAIVRYGGPRDREELWTVTATGADARQLTTGFVDFSPAWTPGGQYIAFARYGSAQGIYLIGPTGGTPSRVVGVSHSLLITAVAWSR